MVRLFALTAALLVVALAAPAAAGGWAVTTLDAVPGRFEAGTAYDIGYTIRQHGVTPVDLESTGIRITSAASGKQITFDGRRDGAVGHYVARVSFPAAGGWKWEALQDWFGPHPLGELEVAAAGAGSAPDARAAAAPVADVRGTAGSGAPAREPAPNALLIAGLLLALAGAAVLFGGRIAAATTTRARA